MPFSDRAREFTSKLEALMDEYQDIILNPASYDDDDEGDVDPIPQNMMRVGWVLITPYMESEAALRGTTRVWNFTMGPPGQLWPMKVGIITTAWSELI